VDTLNQQEFESTVRQSAAVIAFWFEQYQNCEKVLLSGIVDDLERESVIANMDYAQSRLNHYLVKGV